MLLLACLATNVAFFVEVREPFFGDDDPMASVKSAFSDLDIQAKIAEFYPAVQSKAGQSKVDEAKADDVPDAPPPIPVEEVKPAPKVAIPAPREQRRQPAVPANDPPVVPVVVQPVMDPFPPLPQPHIVPTKETLPKESEAPKPAVADVVLDRREPNRQTAAVMPTPALAVVQPVVAEQFKPIIVEPKPATPVKPSATPVWDTIDTIRERPIRYD